MSQACRGAAAVSLMLGKLYDALRSANGVTDDRARQAAEEVAGYESRLATLEGRLLLLTWMVGTNVALTLGVFWMLFTIMGRLR
jgi:hypothetical protein